MSYLMSNFCRTILAPSGVLKNIHELNLLRKGASFSTDVKERISKMIENGKVVVFMKGCPEEPMCGFSNAVVQIFRMHNVEYNSYNILEDDSLRQGIKEYSNWPTIPQVYINGQFVGGCDILLQMHQSGELISELQKAGITSALLSKAVNESVDPK